MKDKVVFISGGSRGLGGSLCEYFRQSGAKVFCASRKGQLPEIIKVPKTEQLVSGILDVVDYSSCENAVEDCLSIFGRIDILINNASGFFGGKEIGSYSASELRSEIEATLLGAINLTNVFVQKASLETIEQHIIFISSISGLLREKDNELFPIYAAAKAGIVRFSECINASTRKHKTYAHTLIPNNIRESNFISEKAISRNDVYRAIQFLVESGENLYVDTIVLDPAQD